ncbi:putative replicase [Insect mesonivirus 1]|uniref:Replicase polyprotein 1ab n=1 Tax=Insect mesonivirus 1 TaxID=2819081 RepID=A0AAE7M8X7_9NIDO|nr:putative replicase [Insect mesonivirus 1]QNM37791.1 putative replicase [Insect mesonivirus 1]
MSPIAPLRRGRLHQLHVVCKSCNDTHTYCDISINQSSTSNIRADRIENLKTKSSISKEFNIYGNIVRMSDFVINHTISPSGLLRTGITPLSLADVERAVRDFDYNLIHQSLQYVTWFPFKYLSLYKTNHALNHNCCMNCRKILSELGLFFHKLMSRCRQFVSNVATKYEFTLTSDNIDLNGILDFEDYVGISSRRVNDILISEIMAPAYHTFYSMYNHLGCYFISSPIYDTFTDNLIDDFADAIYNVKTSTNRPTIDQFYKTMHFHSYLPPNLSTDLRHPLKHWNDFPGGNYNEEHHVHMFPINKTYRAFDKDLLLVEDADLYIVIDFKDYDSHRDYFTQLANLNSVFVYIHDHPLKALYIQRLLNNVLLFWVYSLYDANVNLSHFKLSHDIDIYNTAEYPIIGSCNSTDIQDCELCDIDPLIAMYVTTGRPHCCKSFLHNVSIKRVNPLSEFDERIVSLGDFVTEQNYTKNISQHDTRYIDVELKQYLKAHGLSIVFQRLNSGVHDLEHTIVTDYFVPVATPGALLDDFKLYNQNRSGSISPVTILMSFEIVFNLYVNKVRNSNGILNRPTPIEFVPVRKPHKSSGTPYFSKGDAQTYREVLADKRSEVLKHNEHSLNVGLTYVIPKYALSRKSRIRTILAINMPTSEAGRHVFRHNLEKIKTSASADGPILIGSSPQYLGWDSIIRNLYKQHNIQDHTYLGVNDFPKFDRNVDNALQALSHLLLFTANDPLSVQVPLSSIFCEVFGQYADNTYDYTVLGDSLYVKPGGVTSGNPCTADGNSNIHLLLGYSSFINQFVITDKPCKHHKMRTKICSSLFRTPRAYIESPLFVSNLHSNDNLEYITRELFAIRVLSDDGMVLSNPDVMDYNEYSKNFRIFSNFNMTPDKYHITKPEEGPYEFLSQHTIIVNGHFFPRPEYQKIAATLIYLITENAIQADIALGRNIAHYILLYPYYFYDNNVVKRLLIHLENYICEKTKAGKNYSVDAIRDCVDFDNLIKITTPSSLRTIAQRSHGFDLIGAVPNYEIDSGSLCRSVPQVESSSDLVHCASQLPSHLAEVPVVAPSCIVDDWISLNCVSDQSIVEVSDSACVPLDSIAQASLSLHGCFICDSDTSYMCTICHIYLCHRPGFSHLDCHIESTKHMRVRSTACTFRCNKCGTGDIKRVSVKNICTRCDESVLPIYTDRICLPHTSSKFLSHSPQIITIISNLFLHFANNYYTGAIQCAMELIPHSMWLAYYRLVVFFASLEYNTLRKCEDVYIPSVITAIDGVWYLTFKPALKIDIHGSYYVVDNNGHIRAVDIQHYDTDPIKGENTICFPCDTLNIKRFYHVPINTIANIINSFPTRPSSIISRLFLIQPPNNTDPGDNIEAISLSARKNPLTIVQGPPGTGKTYSCVRVLEQLYRSNPRPRILVCAASHRAVDVVYNAFVSRVGDSSSIVRLQKSIDKSIYGCLRHYVIFTSIQSTSYATGFDYIFIDESSQVPDAYFFNVINHLNATGKLILIGDPFQLACIDNVRLGLDYAYSNIFNFFCVNYYQRNFGLSLIPQYIFLTNHFRSVLPIMTLYSKLFYNDKLICRTEENSFTTPHPNRVNILPVGPSVRGSAGNVLNYSEANVISCLLDELVGCTGIAIITMYQSQRTYLEQVLKNRCPVYTVDSCQGSEFPIVIVSVVEMNNFTVSRNRFNVAISRAKSMLYITRPPIPPSLKAYDIFMKCNTIIYQPITESNEIINPFKNKSNDYINKTSYSIHASDYVFFDTEFVNSKTINGYQYVLGYALRIHTGLTFRTYKCFGRPIVYREHAHEFVPIHYVQKDTYYPSSIAKQRRELLSIARNNSSTNVDPYGIINFCLKHCVSGPIFVVYAGDIDIRYLSGIVKASAPLTCYCLSTAFYYSETKNQSYCQLHANASFITHLTKISVINIRVHPKYIKLNDDSIPYTSNETSLSAVHSTICSELHGSAHDPNVDTYFTFCIFKHFFRTLDITYDYLRSNKHYDPRVTEYKHNFLKQWASNNLNLKLCELGGGNLDIGVRAHNVDVLNGDDMNTHSCDCDAQLLIDSVYYLDEVSKASYIYFDGRPSHYALNYHLKYSYLYSRHANYLHATIPSFNGTDLFVTPCDKEILSRVTLHTAVQDCHIQLNGNNYTACAKHCDDLQNQLSYLKYFGHKFLFVQPITEAITYSTVHKANFILSTLLRTVTLISNHHRLFLGSAGGDVNGVGTIGDMTLQFVRFIPNLICVDSRPIVPKPTIVTYIQTDIAKFSTHLRFDLIISDIWSDQLVFNHLYSIVNQYLVLSGNLVFKITSLVYRNNKAQIQSICAHFDHVFVSRCPSAPNSELFLFCYGHTKTHYDRTLDATIHFHFRNHNQDIKRVNLSVSSFRNTSKPTLMNRTTCTSCYG